MGNVTLEGPGWTCLCLENVTLSGRVSSPCPGQPNKLRLRRWRRTVYPKNYKLNSHKVDSTKTHELNYHIAGYTEKPNKLQIEPINREQSYLNRHGDKLVKIDPKTSVHRPIWKIKSNKNCRFKLFRRRQNFKCKKKLLMQHI